MSIKNRIRKLEKSVTPGQEIEVTVITVITDRREVLLGQAPPDEALRDRVEEKTVRVNPSSRF